MTGRAKYFLIMLIIFSAWFFICKNSAQALTQPAHLWHFDECGGSVSADSVGQENLDQKAKWAVGKWDCAINQPWQAEYAIQKTFSEPLPAGDLTLSFYWRNSSYPNEGRNHVYLKTGSKIIAGLRPSIAAQALFSPSGAHTSIPAAPRDSNWHLITATYSSERLAYYVDGIEQAVFSENFATTTPVTGLEIKGENSPVEMDELAIWSKALSASEVAEVFNNQKPLEPYTERPEQKKAELIHLWSFNEGSGLIARDSVGKTSLSQNAFWSAGKFGSGIEQSWQNKYYVTGEFNEPITSKSLSLDFWFKNSSYPNEGRGSILLQNAGSTNIFGIRPSMSASGFYFDGARIDVFDIIPRDNNWHHLALVYDSYKFYLALYLDGREYIKINKVWFRTPITKLFIQGENSPYMIDELAVWEGALTSEEVAAYYNSNKPHKDTDLEPVILVPGGMGSWNISGKWELDPILHTYDNLWQALKNSGYEEGKNLFAFPYQWRLSNNYTAMLLKDKIQEIKNICNCNKVDLVTHSMGGLVARAYIESNDYEDDVDQLIFLATPHRGATKAYLMWEGGEFGIKRTDLIMERLLFLEADFNSYGSIYRYIREMPMQSIQELLPVYDYLRDKDTMALKTYPNNYPANTFLELLNNSEQLKKLNNIKMINIIANSGENSTANNIRVVNKEFSDGKWEHGYPEHYGMPFTDHGLEYSAGDGTVPFQSNADFNNLENIIINSSHSDIVTDAQKRVIKELTGQEPSQEVRLNMFQKYFLVRIFSPADFLVVSPDGKRLGKDFLTDQPVNEIEGAFYSGFNSDTEFALIPNPLDGEYVVKLEGTGEGEYKLSASLIGEEKAIDQEFTGNILPALQRDFNINYDSTLENPISELEPIDTVAPILTINEPAEGDKYLHSDNLIINYTATDDFSGVSTTTIIIDGSEIATTTIDLFDYSLGQHNFIITVMDKAGNQTQKEVKFEIITDIESAISDIEESFKRGWIKNRIYRELLIKSFKLLKIEDKFFQKEKEILEKLIKKTQNDNKLKEKQKQKLIEQYNKELEILEKNRTNAINHSLGLIIKILEKAKKQGQINQSGYDIIIKDINYLRENL